MQEVLLYRAIAQNNAMFLKLLIKNNPKMIDIIQKCDAVMSEFISSPEFSFTSLANGTDKRLKEIMDYPLYHEIITLIVQILNAYAYNKFNFDYGIGICWGLLPTLIVSASSNQTELVENLLNAIRLTITIHNASGRIFYDSGCLLTVENCHKNTMLQFLKDNDIHDTVLGVIYTDTNYIISGSPTSLATIMENDSINHYCKYINAVKYPLHNPHHNEINENMYKLVNTNLFHGKFNFPVVDLDNGKIITNLPHKELYLRMLKLFAVLPNDIDRFFMKNIVSDVNIYDFGCGGNNGIVSLIKLGLNGKANCGLYNFQFDKCNKNLL